MIGLKNKLLVIASLSLGAAFIDASATSMSEVNILMPAPFADSTSKLVQDFNNSNSRVKIKVTRGPLETESVSDLAISSLMLGNSPYDILLIDVTWLPKYAAANWIYKLDSLIDNKELKELHSGALIGNYYKGILYRWPLVSDIGLLYWRKDLMKEPPKTTKELIEISRRLQSEGKVKYGYVWQGRQYEGLSCVFLEVISGFGGEWLNESSNSNLNSDESVKAVNWLLNLIDSGVSPNSVANFSETEALQAFESGQTAFMRNWPYAWAELNKSKSKVKGKVGITTMVSFDGRNSTSTLGSWGFSILNSSKYKRDSIKVIKYLTSIESQKYLYMNYGYTPTKSILFKDKELTKKNPYLPKIEEALRNTKARPITPIYAQISDVLQRSISAVLTKKSNSTQAMENAHKITNKIINSTGLNK